MSNPSKTRSIAYVGMTVALLAVSAWVAIPLGPVPFTLQTFVLAFALLVLRPGECFAALCAYLVLGAIGVPVFSGMRGGLGMLAGSYGWVSVGLCSGRCGSVFGVGSCGAQGSSCDAAGCDHA